MDYINNFLAKMLPYTEWPMFLLLIGGGVFLIIYSKFVPFRFFGHAIAITAGKYDDKNAKGDVSSFQALSSAVAATVGLGNISGVAIAIHDGGPGVVFWIWITALIGMGIKFYSCSLSIMFRTTDADGKLQGGPMYYITQGLGEKWKPLATFFCICGLFGFLGVFTANQFTETFMLVVKPEETLFAMGNENWKWTIGAVLAILTSFVIFGGLSKIAKVASTIVPFMVFIYLLAVIVVMAINMEKVWPALELIFSEAWNFKTIVTGGFWGLVIIGVRRAMFSNEAGLGSAPMYHGQSKTDNPIKEGLVAMLGPFIDTIVVCTLTAIVIILSGAYTEDISGITMTIEAFERTLFGYGDMLLMLIVSAFALSTLFTYSYYGVKSLSFLTNPKIGKLYNVYFVIMVIFAAVASLDLVKNLIDLSYALMVIPNMIAVLLLAPKVNVAAKAYFKKLKNESA
ncbi:MULTISPECIES: sodium:alanine symporter family protein [unclassified Arenibacter]|jgi:AGCS family alanine or glycine:cation symporter|uniref:alanine/glycine:cation symporter family protein n=1 Tax=unclassified Arenibacter TaxID=2615047 RepID=UPI000E35761F|nr:MULTISPECIES: amino acid carrier protein [unclassified Arenibacter]MCM4163584.1 sodium/alanine symporter [Arenibacter sp. A80]RFT56315.1 alanine:cation symporter family protein [Arenibacter sp. P308M17]